MEEIKGKSSLNMVCVMSRVSFKYSRCLQQEETIEAKDQGSSILATAVSRGHDVLDLTPEVTSVSDIDDCDQNDDDDNLSKENDMLDVRNVL